MIKKLPIGIQTFSKLREDNCVYVDKTALIYKIITIGSRYFLSRPRRFGKSLLVSILAEIFLGNKELFVGLDIESLPYDWKKYPVISISFSDLDCTTPENLNESLKYCLQQIAQQYQINLETKNMPAVMLQDLVKILANQAKVVLLIDEYDYAILKHIHNPEMVNVMREAVKNFYAVIKGLDQYLKFVFLTGVSKFSQTSIFSGLNNLNDIGLDAQFNTLLGYTKREIVTFFDSYLHEAAQYNDCSVEELLEKITEWYDGYLFTNAVGATKIYNPFSVLLFLSKKEFANYWFQTGTPTFLINLLKMYNYPIQKFDKIRVTQEDLGSFDVDIMPLTTLLFQTGYLTICAPDKKTDMYTLSYPNRETAHSFELLGKKVILVGITFDTVLRNISGITHKEL